MESKGQSFDSEVTLYKDDVERYAGLFAAAHFAVRIVLICLAAIIAAEHGLETSPAKFLVPWIPIFAVIVAALTALDTWLRPGQHWKVSKIYALRFAQLRDQVESMSENDAQRLEELKRNFRELQQQHVNDTAP